MGANEGVCWWNKFDDSDDDEDDSGEEDDDDDDAAAATDDDERLHQWWRSLMMAMWPMMNLSLNLMLTMMFKVVARFIQESLDWILTLLRSLPFVTSLMSDKV